MKIKRIGIIGRVADGKPLFDGQTVSTRLWRDELQLKLNQKVYIVDTFEYKKNVFSILFKWIICMFRCSHIVVILSGNGLAFFLPLLYYSNKILHKHIYHRVIGGELDELIKRHPKMVKYFNSFDVNWIQSKKLGEKLTSLGLLNAEYLENFRNITPIDRYEINNNCESPKRFFTFSRVSESKGIGTAIEAIVKINNEAKDVIATLDVYGPIEDCYKDTFNALMKKHSKYVTYKGSIPSSEAVKVLKNYYFHLFPTTWSGEGFPGTLIDCYNAAIPTIASNWAYNSEYIRHGETGYLYNWENVDEFYQVLKIAMKTPEKTLEMRYKCLDEAMKYNCDRVMDKIIRRMQK